MPKISNQKISACKRWNKSINDIERFWSYVDITDLFSCWNWTGSKNKKGYGTFGFNLKVQRTHRIVWILIYGEIPKGMCICHTCDNPSCCNPSHLFLGTNYDNIKDKLNKGRHPVGEKSVMAKLTENQVIEIIQLFKVTSNKVIAKKFDVDESTICNIRAGRKWKHISRI